MKHDALLLDFGGVISKTLFECHEDIERHFGLPPGTLRWRGPLDPQGDDLWRAMLADEITEREYWHRRAAEIGAILGRRLEVSELIGGTRREDPNRIVRPEAVETIRKARAAGRSVGVLSNELELFYGRNASSRFAILNEIDCLVDGSWANILKPSPVAYRRALEATGATAERTVFVDDQPRNVAGARAAGLTAITFDVRDPQSSFRDVENLLEI
jgi:putative hydrolase of the HAD superfamily